MKKLLFSAFILSFLSFSGFSKEEIVARLSAQTRRFLSEWNRNISKKPIDGFVFKEVNGQLCVSAFIKVNDLIDENKLTSIGVFTGTKAGDIWTIQAPVDNILLLAKVKGIDYIDVDIPLTSYLDQARKLTKVDSAHLGYNLPIPMTGKGVLTGIIDAGFDFTHPTFFDTANSTYRVKRVWTQKRNGLPPAGFAYGHELKDPYSIRAAAYDTSITTHGTHVGGIAAGSGWGSVSNSRYRGMAYESDLAFVSIMPQPGQWAVAGATDIIDGASYLFNYAASVFKPCVVNLSWGSSIGPHDGLSLFSQACDAITGAGKVFACSAGNSGNDSIHIEKFYSASDSKLSTFVAFSPYLDSANKKNWIDIWGDTLTNFCLDLKLYNGSIVSDSTISYCIADSTIYDTIMGSDGKPLFISINMAAPEYNGKPHVFVSIHNLSIDEVNLSVSATAGRVNIWQGYIAPPVGYYGAFRSMGQAWATAGDTRMTVSDISSSFSAISVGAYTSKSSFTNVSGAGLGYPGAVVGRIAPFSSRGPVADGRIKPDITGPGFALASAISSFDPSYTPGGDNYDVVIANVIEGGRVYPYAMAAGTSMSSPAVSGIIALMLQMNSTLTPDSVIAILRNTAIVDANTGTLPIQGNNTWGHGKANAYKALRYMAQQVVVNNTITKDPLDCIIYPNPTNGISMLVYQSSLTTSQTILSIADITGKRLFTSSVNVVSGANFFPVDLTNYPQGLYFISLSQGDKSVTIRLVKQ